MTDSFVFYRSFYESIKEFDAETQLAFLTAVMEYALNENEIPLPVVPKALFTAVKPQLDANRKRKEHGNLGGRPRKDAAETEENKQGFSKTETIGFAKKNHRFSNEKPNVNENVNVNVNVNEKKMCSNEHMKEIADAWNVTFANTDVPKVTILKPGSKRAKMLQARLDEFGKEKVIDAIKTAAESSFLTSSSWFSFDWFCCPSNFVKIIEGNYKDHAQQLQAFSQAPKRGSAAELQNFYDAAAKWAEGG